MNRENALGALRKEQHFLKNVIKDFKPEHADFKPKPEMMTVAQQIHHVGHTLDWFREGVFGAGFDLDMENFAREAAKPRKLDEALALVDAAYARLAHEIELADDAGLAETLPENPILGAVPRYIVVVSTSDHTSHHRGSLAVYQRLLGMTPTMPYSE